MGRHATTTLSVESASTAASRNSSLLSWYATNKRDLPWRRTTDPYPVLVSEVMLQQTQVARAIPRFEAFVDRWPTVDDLATATNEQVLAEWSGLGYNSRALRLRDAAIYVSDQGWPTEPAALTALPGIGPYTANAIAVDLLRSTKTSDRHESAADIESLGWPTARRIRSGTVRVQCRRLPCRRLEPSPHGPRIDDLSPERSRCATGARLRRPAQTLRSMFRPHISRALMARRGSYVAPWCALTSWGMVSWRLERDSVDHLKRSAVRLRHSLTRD